PDELLGGPGGRKLDDLDPGLPEDLAGLAAVRRARIGNGVEHAPDAARKDRVGARLRLPVGRAGLERDEEVRSAAPLASGPQGDDLGMRAAVLRMPAFADDLA